LILKKKKYEGKKENEKQDGSLMIDEIRE